MKVYLIILCLCLGGCVGNGNDLETLCMHKDPNQMTDREVEMCKAFMQRPIIVPNQSNFSEQNLLFAGF